MGDVQEKCVREVVIWQRTRLYCLMTTGAGPATSHRTLDSPIKPDSPSPPASLLRPPTAKMALVGMGRRSWVYIMRYAPARFARAGGGFQGIPQSQSGYTPRGSAPRSCRPCPSAAFATSSTAAVRQHRHTALDYSRGYRRDLSSSRVPDLGSIQGPGRSRSHGLDQSSSHKSS